MPEPSESNGLLTEGVRQLWALRSSPLYVMTEALDRSPIHPKRMMETIRTAVPKHLFTIANYLVDKFREAREFRPTCQGCARVENLRSLANHAAAARAKARRSGSNRSRGLNGSWPRHKTRPLSNWHS